MMMDLLGDLLVGLFDLIPNQAREARAGIIGGMVIPAIALVYLLYITHGEHMNTGMSFAIGFSILWISVGGLVGAVGGTITGISVKLIKKHFTDRNQLAKMPSNSAPEMLHSVHTSSSKARRRNVWKWAKENSIMIWSFVGGLLTNVILLLIFILF